MKFRTTGILFLVFAVLAGYVFLVEMKKKSPETPVDKSTWVFTLADDDIQQLTVTDKGQTTIVATDGSAWYVGAVGGEQANETIVGAIVASLVDLKAARVLTQTAEGLAAYGLENPAMTVTLSLGDGQQKALLVGDKNPQGTQYYAQVKGQPSVYMLYSSLVDDLKSLAATPPYKPTPTPAVLVSPVPAEAPLATPTAKP